MKNQDEKLKNSIKLFKIRAFTFIHPSKKVLQVPYVNGFKMFSV
jgi:hypothetical protein